MANIYLDKVAAMVLSPVSKGQIGSVVRSAKRLANDTSFGVKNSGVSTPLVERLKKAN